MDGEVGSAISYNYVPLFGTIEDRALTAPVDLWTFGGIANSLQDGSLSRVCSSDYENSEPDVWVLHFSPRSSGNGRKQESVIDGIRTISWNSFNLRFQHVSDQASGLTPSASDSYTSLIALSGKKICVYQL